MALISDLISVCAQERLDTEATLTVFARRLREAGRLSQAGRGRGAAHATFLDGARLLIAAAATDHPERAVDAEYVFSNFTLDKFNVCEAEHFPLNRENAPTLDIALSLVLEGLWSGTIQEMQNNRHEKINPYLHSTGFRLAASVDFRLRRSGASATICVLNAHYSYFHPALAALVSTSETEGAKLLGVTEDALERETYRFRTAKNLEACLERPLLVAVAQCIGAPRKKEARR